MRLYGSAADGDSSFAPWRFCRVHLADRFKCARHLNTEVAQDLRARLFRVVVEEDVVAVGPQPWLAAKELPQTLSSAASMPSQTAPGATSRRTAAQFAGVNRLYVDGERHWSMLDQIVIQMGSRRRGCLWAASSSLFDL